MNARHFARAGFAVTATAVVLGATQLLGTGAAWAAGSAQGLPTATAASHAPAQSGVHNGGVQIATLPRTPTAVKAGGAPVVIETEMVNFTGAAYQRVFPRITVVGENAHRVGVNLNPSDYTVQAAIRGGWLTLPGASNAVNGRYLDGSVLTVPLADDRATRIMYRVTVNASVAKDVSSVLVVIAAVGDGSVTHVVDVPLKVGRSAATTTPAPVVPVSATTAPVASAPATHAPTTHAPTAGASKTSAPAAAAAVPVAASLAQTGGGGDTSAMLGFGAALLALGAGAAALVLRGKRRAH